MKKGAFLLAILTGFSLWFFLKQKSLENKSDSQVLAQAFSSWPQLQGDPQHSGYVPQTVGPPYTELWRIKNFPVSSRVQAIIADGKVFVPSNDSHLYAISTSNGQTVWTYKTDGPLFNTAAYNGGKVFFGSGDFYIYALNATDGSLVWKYKTGSPVKTAPVVADGKVFIGSSDGYMYALDENTGNLVWKYKIGAPIYDTAAYDNGKIFFGGMDAVGYALDATTGNLIWSLQTKGQGFINRWTVAGNGKVLFTPILAGDYHEAFEQGTLLFGAGASPTIYNQPWSVQKQAILDHLAANPYQQPLYVVDQVTGNTPFTPPVLYTQACQGPHSQAVLLPNGNAHVVYRRSFGEPAQWGATTNDALYTGELDLATGDILPIDRCSPGTGGWADCGSYKSPYTSDEPSELVTSGEIIYLQIGRGLVGLDQQNQTLLQTLACFNPTSGGPFCDAAPVMFSDYNFVADTNGWRPLHPGQEESCQQYAPVPIVDDTFYILHSSDLVAVKGTKR